MEDIIFSVADTKTAFEKHSRMSWTNFDSYQTCPGGWFINYYLRRPKDVEYEPLPKEHSRAIPGTVIQKLMEVFINERVYSRPEMSSMEAILNWFHLNTKAAYKLGAFPVEKQFDKDFLNTYSFWDKEFGKRHYREMCRVHGLDPAINTINLSFLDYMTFKSIYESEEALLIHLSSLFPKILQVFLQRQFFLDRMLSEISLKVPVDEYTLTGSVDFIYNPKQKDDTCFTTLTQLENNYFLFDGKYNVASYTKKEQLFFYCALLEQSTGKTPDKVALVDWSKAVFKEFDYDREYKKHILSVLSKAKETAKQIEQYLNSNTGNRNFFQDGFLPLCASNNNCQFCIASSVCPEAQKEGVVDFIDLSQKMFAKKEAKKLISSLDTTNCTNPEVCL